MNILIEDTIPLGPEYFSALGDVKTYAWQQLSASMLKDVDFFVVRSTTKVTSALLAQANRLKLVTTATAGTNHLDTAGLDKMGIPWKSAAGCNAVAVAEYVLSSLVAAEADQFLSLSGATVGIVGAGHVGTALARLLDILNIRYRLCDPLKEKAGDSRTFSSMGDILDCDVISLHVPYTRSGEHPTAHMINADVLASLSPEQLLINACRGEVIDETALINHYQTKAGPRLVLDVFDNEPDINPEMMSLAWLSTPHIAGHSVEGKVRGTQMVYEQVCQACDVRPTISLDRMLTPLPVTTLSLNAPGSDTLCATDAKKVINCAYDIQFDDRHFRQAMAESNQFAQLRKHYRQRRECSAYTLQFPHDISAGIRRQLCGLGFSVLS